MRLIRMVLGVCLCACLSPGCGAPSAEDCDKCRSIVNQITQQAYKEGISPTGVCGDLTTGEGAAAGFEHACQVFRETCSFDLGACSGDTDERAAILGTGSPTP